MLAGSFTVTEILTLESHLLQRGRYRDRMLIIAGTQVGYSITELLTWTFGHLGAARPKRTIHLFCYTTRRCCVTLPVCRYPYYATPIGAIRLKCFCISSACPPAHSVPLKFPLSNPTSLPKLANATRC